ncbi:interaptin, partial [Diaphorina citri]|uniref:Interaptin n=1 Tax=Diaphorina citri TaxID=121845 RepID=A0A3Q0JPT1_DIACI
MPKKTRTRSQSRARAPKDMLGNFDDPDYLKLKIEMTKADNDQKNSKMKQIFDKACEHWIVNKREADKWEQECNKLDENLNQLKMDNFGMSTKIEELESSITNILKENQQHSEENEETKTKLILAEKKIEELETVKTSMNRKLKEDAETKKYYDELLADTDKEISEYKERIKQNNKHIKELKEQVTELEGMIGEQVHLKDRVGKLEDENSGLKLTITSLNKTIEDLKSHDINEIRNMYNLTDDLDITVDNTPLVQLRKSLVFQNSCSEKTLSDELYENTQVENAIDLDITTSQDFIVRSPKTKTTNKTLTQPVKITTPIQQPSRPPTSPLPQAQPPSQVQPLPHAEPVTLHSSSTSSQFKCMLIGDSHARELKTHLENTGNKQCNYFVKCSPGASFTKLQADPKIILGENDFMILLGGTNDIFKTPVLDIEQHLIQTLRVNSTQMKTIVVSIPFRYSKPSVNKHIKLVNKKIRTVVDTFKNSVFFDINRRINKKHYANDKFHLNRSGKIKLSEGLNKIINKKSIFEDKNKGPTDTQNKKINTKASQENHSRQNRTENEDKNKNKKISYSMPKKTRTRSQSRARAPKDMLGNFDDPDYLKLKIEMTKADNDQKNSKMKQIFDKACEHWIVNKREADKWEQECNKLDENLNQLKMDNFGMSTKIEELESSITNILKENQQQSEENEETKTKLILAEKKIEELETVKTSMNRKLKEDAETKKYYDELLADTDKEISEYKERIKQNNKHIKELKEQVTELEGMIGEQVHLKDRVGKLEDENSGLKLTITSLNKTIEDLKSHDINEIRNMYNLTDDLDITVDNTPLVQLRKSLVFQNSCSEKTLSDELYENTQVENAIDLDITTSQDFIVRSPKTKTTNKTLTQPVKITTPIQQPSRPPTSPLPQAQPPSQVQPLPHAEPVTLHSSSTSSQFKCMLIGDSHARELKTHLENTGNKQCNYFVKCSPGASFTKLQADPKIIL